MAIGDGDIDVALFDFCTIDRRADFHGPRPGEDLGQRGVAVGAHVQHDEDRRGEVRRQITDEADQRLDTAGRRPDDDDVMARHRLAFP
jgi:hypothetical protein